MGTPCPPDEVSGEAKLRPNDLGQIGAPWARASLLSCSVPVPCIVCKQEVLHRQEQGGCSRCCQLSRSQVVVVGWY